MESKGNAILDARNPWDPVAGFTPAIAAAKSKGAICLAQLQHPGRQCPASINPRPKSASDVLLKPCFNKSYGQPSPLTRAEIKAIVEKYVWASRIMAEAGADGIMVRPRFHNIAHLPMFLFTFPRAHIFNVAPRLSWLPHHTVPKSANEQAKR